MDCSRLVDDLAERVGPRCGNVWNRALKPVPLLHDASCLPYDPLEHAVLDPSKEPTMDGALAAEPDGQIVPLGSVVENPEDALKHVSFVGRRSPAQGAGGMVGDPFTKPVNLLIREFHRAEPNDAAKVSAVEIAYHGRTLNAT